MTQGSATGDTEQESDGHSTTAKVAPHLFLVLDADRLEDGGRRWSLADVDEVVFVRAEAYAESRTGRTLTLGLPGKTLSGRHARLRRVRGEWELEDLGSRNGTFLLEQRLSRSTVIQDAQFFEMARFFFMVRSGPAATEQSLLQALDPRVIASVQALFQVAVSSVPILIQGETGTGKEVHARAAHEASRRAGRFVAVNCGALPATMVEAQMFGHVRGAFTGAVRDEPGLVRMATGGTLFLDEIADLGPSAQAALLRVLQEREVLPIGGRIPVPVDLRIVSATHRDLDAEVREGRFRDDLLARLRGYEHLLSPLRHRRSDLGQLAAAIVKEALPTGRLALAPAAARALLKYDYPYNVRELRQILLAAAALSGEAPIAVGHLPARVQNPALQRKATPLLDEEKIDPELRARLVEQLTAHQGNVAAVARAMSKAPAQIHRWMKRNGLDPADYR